MLAATCGDLNSIRFPVLASPKIDGIRCVTIDDVPSPGQSSVPMTRSLKYIPNRHTFREVAKLPPGLDGELVTGSFHDTTSGVMSYQGTPVFRYLCFDLFQYQGQLLRKEEYQYRVKMLKELIDNLEVPYLEMLPQTQIASLDALQAYEALQIELGHEGVCFRSLNSPYKFGRSTFAEQWLVKLKRFEDAEAVVIDFEELYSNQNAPEQSELGYQERSSKQEGLVPMGILGALVVRREDGVEFKIGTGFSREDRALIWVNRSKYSSATVTYKHQPFGQKDKPRIPVFKGLRKDL